MRRIYVGGNLFWAYLKDAKKVVPFIWSEDRTKVKNIENGDVLDYYNDDRFLHDIIKCKYAQKEQVQIIEFPKVLSMLTSLEKGIFLGIDAYANPNTTLYSKRQVANATKKIEDVLSKKETQKELQK